MTYLTPEECARRASLSRKAIYRAVEDGELEGFKVRTRVRIPEDAFERWIRANPAARPVRPAPVASTSRRGAPEGSFRTALRAIGEDAA